MIKRKPHQLVLEQLEERIFFDANPAVVLTEPIDGDAQTISADGATMQAEAVAAAGNSGEVTQPEESEVTEINFEDETAVSATDPVESTGNDQELEVATTGAAETEDSTELEIDPDAGTVTDPENTEEGVVQASSTGTQDPVAVESLTDQQTAGSEVPESGTSQNLESLADDETLIPVLAEAIDPLIGEDFTFTVALENDAASAVPLYGPYIDLYFQSSGDDGDGDGIIFGRNDGSTNGAASYLGSSLNTTVLTYDGTNPLLHPYAVDNSGDSLQITTNPDGSSLQAEDTLVVVELPFGSYTPGQPAAEVEITAHISELARVDDTGGNGFDLDVQVTNGFRYGNNPIADPATDPSITYNDDANLKQATQTFRPEVIRFEKEYNGSEQETATGPNYVQTYSVEVDVASGQTIDNLRIIDALPENIYYVGNVKVDGVGISSPLSPGVYKSQNLDLNLGTIIGADGVDAVVTYDFYVPYLDADSALVINRADSGTADETSVIVDTEVRGTWTPLDGDDPVENIVMDTEVFDDGTFSSTPNEDEEFEAKALTIQKSVSLANDVGAIGKYNPGDIVQYTLEFQVSDYVSVGDIVITDILPDGLDFLTGGGYDATYMVTAAENPLDVDPDAIDQWSGTWSYGSDLTETVIADDDIELVFNVSDVAGVGAAGILRGSLANVADNSQDGSKGAPATGTITYYAQVREAYDSEDLNDTFIDQGDSFTNSVSIEGDIYSGDPAVIGSLAVTDNEVDSSGASFAIATGAVTKSVYAIDSGDPDPDGDGSYHMQPGDVVTYRLTYTLPTSDYESFSLVDYLPLPVLDVDDQSFQIAVDDSGGIPVETTDFTSLPASGHVRILGSDTFYDQSGELPAISWDSTTNSVSFNYDAYHSGTSPGTTIDLVFSVTVGSDVFTDGLYLTNQVRATESGTDGTDVPSDQIVQIVLDQPELSITKGVVETDNDIVDATTPVFSAKADVDDLFTEPGSVGSRLESGETISSQWLTTGSNTLDTNLSSIDAGDLVTFAIVIENSGHYGAFDIKIEDQLPAGFEIPTGGNGLNLTVTKGDGSLLTSGSDYTVVGGDFFSGGIEFVDGGGAALSALNGATRADDNSGDNIFIVTYDLLASTSVAALETIENTATLSQYSNADGAQSHIAAGEELTDSANVTIATPSISKSIVSTSQPHTGNAPYELAVGEEVVYRVDLVIAEGTSSGVILADTFTHSQPGQALSLVTLDTLSASAGLSTLYGDPLDNSYLSTPYVIIAGSGGSFSIDFGTLVNSNTSNGVDETISLTYTAVLLNNEYTNQGDTVNNSASLDWTENTGSALQNSGGDLTIVEPFLEVAKSVDTSVADAGDTVTFTITLNHGSSSDADALDVTLADTIPAGFENVTIVSENGPAPVGGSATVTGNDITAVWDSFALADIYEIVISADLVAGVQASEVLTNSASLDWTSIGEDADPNERSGTSDLSDEDDYLVSADVSVTVPAGTIDKVDPANSAYTIGEQVQYYMLVTLPEGETHNFSIIDNLPVGMSYVAGSHQIFTTTVLDPSGLLGLDFSGSALVLQSVSGGSGDGDDVQFNYGDIAIAADNDGSGENDAFVIGFKGLVTNNLANQDDSDEAGPLSATALLNQVSMSYDNPAGGSAITVEDPTDPVVNIQESWITTTKLVADSADIGTDVTPGELLTYTVRFENSGNSIAYETNGIDTLVVGTEYVNLISAVYHDTSGSLDTDILGNSSATDNGDGTVSFGSVDYTSDDSWDIAPGDYVEIQYTVTVLAAGFSPGPHTNSVDATWSSLDGVAASGERLYDDNPNYLVDGSQDVSTAQFSVLTTGSIGDIVFFDSDNINGFSADDVGITGVAVTITADVDGDGTLEYTQTVTTNVNGNYLFTSLPGFDDYVITVDFMGDVGPFDLEANGYSQTFDLDEDGSPALDHIASSIALVTGEDRTDVNFGYNGSQLVSNLVWYDGDGDAVQPDIDTNEDGLGGITVLIDADIDGDSNFEYHSSVVTADNGSYVFNYLPAGDYTISIDPFAGLVGTFDENGSNDNTTSFSLPDLGGDRVDIDFGIRGDSSVGDRVFFDIDSNGIEDEAAVDFGIRGVDVTLSVDIDGDGFADYSTTTTTDDDGLYLFANLLPGTYNLSVDENDLPLGMHQQVDPGGGGSLDGEHDQVLVAAETVRSVDFGYSGDGSIGDTIWWDGNNNGFQDANEAGLNNVVLQLMVDHDGDGTIEILGTTITDASGSFQFSNLPSVDEYVVTILSGIEALATPTYDFDGIATIGTTTYDLGYDSFSGQVENTTLVDFGFKGVGTIGDRVWNDFNNNGILDLDSGGLPLESGLAGVVVTLSADLDRLVGNGEEFVVTTTTGADGTYSFEGLFTSVAGIGYTVTIDQSSLPLSANPTHDRDDPAGGGGAGTPDSTAVTLTDVSAFFADVDFGYNISSTIGDTIWLDVDGDGVQGAAENGIGNITVTLFDGGGTQVAQQLTGDDGSYLFENLAAGNYRVDVTNLPLGLQQSYDADGIATPNSAEVTVAAGDAVLALDFGYLGIGSIGDRVWNDLDGDTTDNGGVERGLSGVTVTLNGDLNNDGDTTDPGDTITTTTNRNGDYLFEGIFAGNYSVTVSDLPAGMVQTYDFEGGLDDSAAVLVGGANPLNTDLIDFGYRQTAALGDRVWNDQDGDGVQDSGELGLSGVTMTLFDLSNVQIAQVDTDATGSYIFNNITPGRYYVTVDTADLPTGMVQTWDYDDRNPSGTFDTPDQSGLITLGALQVRENVDFGYTGTAAVGNTIWQDFDGDTTDNGGTEPGIAGVEVTLTGDLDNDGFADDTLTTTTDNDGNYSFTNLPAGTYTIGVDENSLPPGMIPTFDSDGLGTIHEVSGSVGSGTTNNDFDFGYQQTGTVGDTVWYDLDKDGVRDKGEFGLVNILVTLTGDIDGDGDQDSLSKPTNSDGEYFFNGLAPGTYTVTVDTDTLPGGWLQTFDSDDHLATPDSSEVTIGLNEADLDLEFGYTGTGTIGDTVWYDANQNKVFDGGDVGISGNRVTLNGDLNNDGIANETIFRVTNNGRYAFNNLFEGTYSITVNTASFPGGAKQTRDPDGVRDNATVVTLGPGERNRAQDFAYYWKLPDVLPPATEIEPEIIPEIPEVKVAAVSRPVVSTVAPLVETPPFFVNDAIFLRAVGLRQVLDVDAFTDVVDSFDDFSVGLGSVGSFVNPGDGSGRFEQVFARPLLPVSPVYSGHAEPGTSLRIDLYDAMGNTLGSQTVMADSGGNWLVNFSGDLLLDMPHHIDFSQSMSLLNDTTPGGFNLRTYFMPALGASPFSTHNMTVDSIFAMQPYEVLRSLENHYNQPGNLEWNDSYDYEHLAPSTNPAQTVL